MFPDRRTAFEGGFRLLIKLWVVHFVPFRSVLARMQSSSVSGRSLTAMRSLFPCPCCRLPLFDTLDFVFSFCQVPQRVSALRFLLGSFRSSAPWKFAEGSLR